MVDQITSVDPAYKHNLKWILVVDPSKLTNFGQILGKTNVIKTA